jgi:hypothetical protein
MMRRVKRSVRQMTNEKQTPWSSDALTVQFFFKPNPSATRLTQKVRPLRQATKGSVKEQVRDAGDDRAQPPAGTQVLQDNWLAKLRRQSSRLDRRLVLYWPVPCWQFRLGCSSIIC